jgi:hypothetical protein
MALGNYLYIAKHEPSWRELESRDRMHRNTQDVRPAVPGSDGTDHSVTAAKSKTESERRQGKKKNGMSVQRQGCTPET